MLTTRCLIAGGGPAGLMLGYLLARAGIDVTVLEKHADFLRDFRGDTIHPSTLQVMHELGLLDAFLQLPHTKTEKLGVNIGPHVVQIADFTHLPTKCGYIAMMPQWDFLNFLAARATGFPNFRLMMSTEAAGLIEDNGRITGLHAIGPDGPLDIHADLTIAADGRGSTVREAAMLQLEDFGAPIDVLWFRLSHRASDPVRSLGRVDAGQVLVMLDRGAYWQCAYVIRKGGFANIRDRGLDIFRETLSALMPALRDRVFEIRGWDDVKLLTVAVNRLTTWHRPGLLCIGDAAHAMSPIGGVGVNLAIQDAVAAANLLRDALRRGAPTEAELAAVQRRRMWPVKMTQRLQVLAQNRIFGAVLAGASVTKLPWPLKLMRAFPILRRIPARIIGMGFRPEHVSL